MEHNNKNSNIINTLTYVAEQTMALAKENSVLGEPVEKDGITVIPVSKISASFAGGGADMEDRDRKKNRHPAGGGAKVTLTPMSFFVIQNGEVQSLSINAPENSPLAEIIDTVIETVKNIIHKKSEEK